jgi:hypothetical protein
MSDEVDESSEGLADQPPTLHAGLLVGVMEEYEEHCDTEFGPQIDAHAWSAGDPASAVSPYRVHHSWPVVWQYAAALFSIGVALAITIATVLYVSYAAHRNDDQLTVPATETPAAATDTALPPDPPPPPFEPSWNVADHTTPDGAFLQGVRAADWQFTDTDAAIKDAHQWCSEMRQGGYRPAFVAKALWANYGALKPGYPDYPTSVKIVNAAVAAYCPDRA